MTKDETKEAIRELSKPQDLSAPLLKYKLDGHTPVVAKNFLEWAVWYERADTVVARDELPNGILVSTVFLGTDHNFSRRGPPLLFETMVFYADRDLDDLQHRYSTWDEALEGHRLTVKSISKAFKYDINVTRKT